MTVSDESPIDERGHHVILLLLECLWSSKETVCVYTF